MFENQGMAVQNPIAAPILPASRFDHVKAALRQEAGDTAFRSWLAPLSFVSFTGSALEISAPTRFVRDWVKTHYSDRIRALWNQQGTPCLRVDCLVSAAPAQQKTVVSAFEEIPVANENSAETTDVLSSPLDPRFTFDNFVTGDSNELAFAAARRVSDSDSVQFNPLFIQGGVGLGKTHLLHAMAHEIRQRAPQRRVVYMSAERFMYTFVRALREKNTFSFKENFRSIDVLMIDDIQFICGKETTQQEFFHTFNALVDQGKQVILSADRNPAELDGIDERLRSRLGMGLVAGISAPDESLRLRILQSKCALLKREIPADVLAFLAAKIPASGRELEGALNRLVAHADLVGRSITKDTAAELLSDLLRASERRITVEDIQKRVAEHYGIRTADILSPRRARPVARPRQIAMYLSKALTQLSLPDIGRKFGGRDHTTIIHGVRRIEGLMNEDAALRDDVHLLRRMIAG